MDAQEVVSKQLCPDSNVHGADMGPTGGPVGPRWAPCWPHEPCYQGCYFVVSYDVIVYTNDTISAPLVSFICI